MTSALISTLIRQWAREYLQYSRPSAAPHKRGRVRAYLFAGLSRFHMRRLIYGVPVLLHVSVFLFFYALSEWLYPINVTVGATARYSLVALLTVYLVLSVLPLIARNAPYQTALTTPLQACVSLIQLSYIVLHRLAWPSSPDYEIQRVSGLFRSLNFDRARALVKEVKKKERASELDRSAIQWLLQELDEDDMDNFLSGLPGYIHSPSGLPGYIHSPLVDKKLVVKDLIADMVPARIRKHVTTCLRSVELSQEESMSRASICISSLKSIFETAANLEIGQSWQTRFGNDEIRAILEYFQPLRHDSSIALRALCIRCLVIREFLIPNANSDAEELQARKFPNYLMPIFRVILVWKRTEIAQWSHLDGILTLASYHLPRDEEMWMDVLYDGPLINLAVLAHGLLSLASKGGLGDVNLDMAWKTFETLLKSLSLAQVRVSELALKRFNEVLLKARAGNSGYERGRAQITTLLKMLEIVNSGLHLAEAFTYTPKPMLTPRQIEAIFGPEQLRNGELLEAFAACLPRLVSASTPESSKNFMERLILEDKLWEQLHFSLIKCLDMQVPFPDKLRIIMIFFDIFDVAFEILKESSIDWRSPDLDLLYGHLQEFQKDVAPGMFIGRVVYFRSAVFQGQFCHALLAQFAKQRSHGEPLMHHLLPSLSTLVGLLGAGTQEGTEKLTLRTLRSSRTRPDMGKANATLNVILRDGPLSNFFILGTTILEAIVSKASDVTLGDIKKLWRLFERMLNTQHLSLADASAEKWATFDHLRATVLVAVAMGGNSSHAEDFRPLLDIIEKVDCMRPADRSAEEPIPGSSREFEAPFPAAAGPRDQRLLHPLLSTDSLAAADQFTPHSATPPDQSNLDPTVVNELSSPTTQRTGDDARFARPLIPSRNRSGPRRAASLDPANIQAHMHMQFALTDTPFAPDGVLSHPYPSPPSSCSLDGPPGCVNQYITVPANRACGHPTPDSHKDGTYRSKSLCCK